METTHGRILCDITVFLGPNLPRLWPTMFFQLCIAANGGAFNSICHVALEWVPLENPSKVEGKILTEKHALTTLVSGVVLPHTQLPVLFALNAMFSGFTSGIVKIKRCCIYVADKCLLISRRE